jgi:hypothetical protein
VSRDIRLIVHQNDASHLLCYVGHHDEAYDWAERRKLETHPKTGAAQLVEIHETVKEIVVPVYVPTEIAAKPQPAAEKNFIFAGVSDDEILGYGVPAEWLNDIKKSTEDTLLELTGHLPAEAAEALLELATGGKPRVPQPAVAVANPFDHPDAQRRFRVMANVEELQRALDFPWEKWTVFLHPEQCQMVERDYAGPARIAGSAGTGKTIVALHRAAHLARTNRDARVLLTTFSDTLANALRTKLTRLLGNRVSRNGLMFTRSTPSVFVSTMPTSGRRRSLAARLYASCCKRLRVPWAATNSACIFSSPNGSRWLMPGSWRTGRSIAMSRVSAERLGSRKHSAGCCGRSLSGFARSCVRES